MFHVTLILLRVLMKIKELLVVSQRIPNLPAGGGVKRRFPKFVPVCEPLFFSVNLCDIAIGYRN